METIGTWLLQELETRGWSQSELARRAHLGNATLSRIISGSRQAGPDAALQIARALGEAPENVFRLAGLLPSRIARGDVDPELRATADRLLEIWQMLEELDPASSDRLQRIAILQAEMVLAAARPKKNRNEDTS